MIVFAAEGCLSTSDGRLFGTFASDVAKQLYGVLHASGSPISVVSADLRDSEVEAWLALEGFPKWSFVYARGATQMSYVEWKVLIVKRLMASTHRVTFIDKDPQTVQQVAQLGAPALLLVDPFQRPGRITLGTENGYVPWDELSASIVEKKRQSAVVQVALNEEIVEE